MGLLGEIVELEARKAGLLAECAMLDRSLTAQKRAHAQAEATIQARLSGLTAQCQDAEARLVRLHAAEHEAGSP